MIVIIWLARIWYQIVQNDMKSFNRWRETKFNHKLKTSVFETILKSFKHIIVSTQSGDASSLYLVSMRCITLKETLRSFQSVTKYNHENIDYEKKDKI